MRISPIDPDEVNGRDFDALLDTMEPKTIKDSPRRLYHVLKCHRPQRNTVEQTRAQLDERIRLAQRLAAIREARDE